MGLLARCARRVILAAAFGASLHLAIAAAAPVTLVYTHPPAGQHACRCGGRAPLEVAP